MKNFLIAASILLVVSCKQDASLDYVVISGKVSNLGDSELTINTNDRSFTETLELSSDGSFTDTLYVKSPSYVLYDSQHPVFLHLEPGYNLNISYDNDDFENTLSITGTGAEANNYLREKKSLTKEKFGNSKDTYSLNEEEFKEKMLALKTTQDSMLSPIADLA